MILIPLAILGLCLLAFRRRAWLLSMVVLAAVGCGACTPAAVGPTIIHQVHVDSETDAYDVHTRLCTSKKPLPNSECNLQKFGFKPQ